MFVVPLDVTGVLGITTRPLGGEGLKREILAFEIPDFGVPENAEAFLDLTARLARGVREGSAVAIHCRGGIGRSGLLAVAVTMALGQSLEFALAAVSTARGVQVPEAPVQGEWLRQHATELSELLSASGPPPTLSR